MIKRARCDKIILSREYPCIMTCAKREKERLMGKIRVGVFGAGRGLEIAKNFMLLDADIVALCDYHQGRREAALKQLDRSVAAYESFDEFIEHPMDAVILANNFYQHAPFAIKCFERNIHVFCECVSNGTMPSSPMAAGRRSSLKKMEKSSREARKFSA